MHAQKMHRTLIIIVLSILGMSLLSGVATVWAEANPNLAEISSGSAPLIPPAQGEGPVTRPTSSFDDLIVQTVADSAVISPQSDSSGVEIVPAAAFIHTGELNTSTQAEDWLFHLDWGVLMSDSSTDEVCLTAPVYLTPGSVIESFTAYLFDGSPTENIFVYLDRTSVLGGWDELAAVQTTGNIGTIQMITDPSIYSVDGANIVSDFYNYNVNLCLPADTFNFIVVLGAKVNTSVPIGNVYLPIVLKSPPPTTPQIKFSLKNETGGTVVQYTVHDTPQGTINCPANISNGATAFCGIFDAGTYDVSVNFTGPDCGGPDSGSLTFPEGTCTRIVRCGRNNPAEWQCN